MYSNILALFAGLSTLAAAVPTGTAKEPCAQISHIYQQQQQQQQQTEKQRLQCMPLRSSYDVSAAN